KRERSELISLLEGPDRDEIDETVDEQAIAGKVISARLAKASDDEIREMVSAIWADFDLQSEVERIEQTELKAEYRSWLDSVVRGKPFTGSFKTIRGQVIGIL